MGKPTGFIEFPRELPTRRPVSQRIEDFLEVYNPFPEEKLRAEVKQPSFIEAHTYRIQGHLEAEDLFLGGQRYREPEEIESWKKRGPIEVTRKQLEAGGPAAIAQLQEIEKRVMAKVDAAVRFAVESPPADPELAFTLMFDGQRP